VLTDIAGFSEILVRYVLLKRIRLSILTGERLANAIKLNNFVLILGFVTGILFCAYKSRDVILVYSSAVSGLLKDC
jgi:hypothetical protein